MPKSESCLSVFQVGVRTRLLFDGDKDPAIQQRHKTGGLYRFGHTGLLDEYVILCTVHCILRGQNQISQLYVMEELMGLLLVSWTHSRRVWHSLAFY